MRGIVLKYIAFVMALVLALSSLVFLPVMAEESEDHFMFEHLEDTDGGVYQPAGAQISLPVQEQSVYNAIGLTPVSAQNNAFYISLTNSSSATQIRVSYTYKVQGDVTTEVVQGSLTPWGGKQTLTLPCARFGEQMENLQISFFADTSLSGTVGLNAFFDISTYVQETQSGATLSRCHYDGESKQLLLDGSLSYAATVRYEGETLALFALGEGDDLHLSGKTPIARTDISFNFSFSIPISRNDELYKRYVVAAITSAGERVPLCTPTYPSFFAANTAADQGFKGYHSQDFSAVMDNVPDVCVIDVYLDRLFGTQSEGILYAGEYDYYYFDQAYVTDLERRVKNLAGIGTSVYLRLLIGNSRDTLSFADEAPADAVNRLAVLRNEKAQRDLYAVVDFLTARLQQSGELTGLILGRSADLISQYSYADVTTMAQYSAFYAATLNLVCGVARLNIPTIQMLLPISDTVWAESASSVQDGRIFYAKLFLPSLLSALEAQILEPQSFGLMLESSTLSDRTGGVDETHYGIDRLAEFLAELESTAAAYPYLSASVVFSWQPDGKTEDSILHADYLLKYALLSQNARVSSFLLDFSVAEEQGKESGAQSLNYLAKYINTDRCADAAQLALSALGVASLDRLYDGAAQWIARRVYRTDLTQGGFVGGANVKGSYSLWSFSSADNALGWYEGTVSESFFVSSANQSTHTLVAQFAAESGYGEIAYHFDSPVDLSFAPLFAMPLSISGKQGARYELQLRMIGENAVTYASAIVNEGESETLYLDLSKAEYTLSELRSIRLMARPLDGDSEAFQLHFGGMTIQSDTLSDKELADRVSAIWQHNAENGADEPVRDYTVPLLITAIVAAASVAACALLLFSHKSKKKRSAKRT